MPYPPSQVYIPFTPGRHGITNTYEHTRSKREEGVEGREKTSKTKEDRRKGAYKRSREEEREQVE